jgi:hypothetical protein
LCTNADGVIPQLPIPDFEFAIIAGGRGGGGYNPLIDGDDDLVVTVASTFLPGAADWMTVHAVHTLLATNPAVIDATVRFLQCGRLHPRGDRHPIPRQVRADAGAARIPGGDRPIRICQNS